MITLSVADFVSIMHDIDAAKSRTCGECAAYRALSLGGSRDCRKGRLPAGPDDGCGDYTPRKVADRSDVSLGRVVADTPNRLTEPCLELDGEDGEKADELIAEAIRAL